MTKFWSSVDLTGNQTPRWSGRAHAVFWSSVDLTGNQTHKQMVDLGLVFWSSVDLTGNQTLTGSHPHTLSFGAVSI